MPSGQRNREREGCRCAGGVHCRGVCLEVKQEPDCRLRIGSTVSLFLHFLQIHCKVSNVTMRTHVVICRQEMSSKNLIVCNTRKKKKRAGSKKVNPALIFLSLSGAESL